MRCEHCGTEHSPCYLGTLGTLAWLRCRHCGGEWSVPADELEADFE